MSIDAGKTRKLWIGTEPSTERFSFGPYPNDRLVVDVSESDYQRIASIKWTTAIVSFRDALTGTIYSVRYADCGADCRCALELV